MGAITEISSLLNILLSKTIKCFIFATFLYFLFDLLSSLNVSIPFGFVKISSMNYGNASSSSLYFTLRLAYINFRAMIIKD